MKRKTRLYYYLTCQIECCEFQEEGFMYCVWMHLALATPLSMSCLLGQTILRILLCSGTRSSERCPWKNLNAALMWTVGLMSHNNRRWNSPVYHVKIFGRTNTFLDDQRKCLKTETDDWQRRARDQNKTMKKPNYGAQAPLHPYIADHKKHHNKKTVSMPYSSYLHCCVHQEGHWCFVHCEPTSLELFGLSP